MASFESDMPPHKNGASLEIKSTVQTEEDENPRNEIIKSAGEKMQ